MLLFSWACLTCRDDEAVPALGRGWNRDQGVRSVCAAYNKVVTAGRLCALSPAEGLLDAAVLACQAVLCCATQSSLVPPL